MSLDLTDIFTTAYLIFKLLGKIKDSIGSKNSTVVGFNDLLPSLNVTVQQYFGFMFNTTSVYKKETSFIRKTSGFKKK